MDDDERAVIVAELTTPAERVLDVFSEAAEVDKATNPLTAVLGAAGEDDVEFAGGVPWRNAESHSGGSTCGQFQS